jgi:NADP-dependent 3-hydroxy acid dehydrogenase YdfG
MELEDSVALVTGASSGIGEATAKALAADGASVAIAARREDRLESVADDIESAGGEALVLPTDVTEEDEVVAMVRDTVDAFGRLDVLVNNAGVMLLEPVSRADRDNWRQMMEVNLLGLMNATHEAVDVMTEQGQGHVVNVSSVAGVNATATASGYNASKFGVNGFSEALRQEMASEGVRVTVVEPGAVETELPQHIPDEQVKKQMAERFGDVESLKPEDIANAIVYTVSQPQRVSLNELLIRPTEQR